MPLQNLGWTDEEVKSIGCNDRGDDYVTHKMFPMRLRAGNSAVDSDSDSDSDFGCETVNSHMRSFSHDTRNGGTPWSMMEKRR